MGILILLDPVSGHGWDGMGWPGCPNDPIFNMTLGIMAPLPEHVTRRVLTV